MKRFELPAISLAFVLFSILLYVPESSGADTDDKLGTEFTYFMNAVEALADSAADSSTQIDMQRVSELFEESFGRYTSPERLQAISDIGLDRLYLAADAAVFYALDPDIAVILESVADVLAAREQVPSLKIPPHFDVGEDYYLERVYEKLIVVRAFERADSFASKHGLSPVRWNIEDVAPGPGPAYMEIDRIDDVTHLIRKSIDVSAGQWIVAIVHPNCGFSLRATQFIESDDLLLSKFSNKAIWLVDQRRSLPLQPLIEWNRREASINMVLSYSNSEWTKEIGFMQTPVFHFLNDGELVDRVIGWPGDEQGERLRDAFRAMEAAQSDSDA